MQYLFTTNTCWSVSQAGRTQRFPTPLYLVGWPSRSSQLDNAGIFLLFTQSTERTLDRLAPPPFDFTLWNALLLLLLLLSLLSEIVEPADVR